MSSPAVPTARRGAANPRPSLFATVLRLAAVATIAAVLIWSVLFVDLLHQRGDTASALSQPGGQLSAPDGGRSTPAPLTTRTS